MNLMNKNESKKEVSKRKDVGTNRLAENTAQKSRFLIIYL